MAASEGTSGPTAVPTPIPTQIPGLPEDCSSDDPQAVGWHPVPILRQIAAVCTYPKLLDDLTVPVTARHRARSILQDMDAANIGGYNHEHRELGVPSRIAQFLQRRDRGTHCDPGQVVLTSGTASILPFVLSLLVDNGSVLPTGVLVPVPGPRLLRVAVELAGAVAVPYLLSEEQGWALRVGELQQLLRQERGRCHPKVLCVVNPGDPTGHVLGRQDMEAVVRLVAQENFLLLADEGQQDLTFDPKHPFLSFRRVLGEMGEPWATSVQLISFYSLSRSIARESGFRAGFLDLVNVDKDVIRSFQLAQSIPRPCVLGRVLLDLLMDPPEEGDPIQQALQEQRQALGQALAHSARLVQELLGPAPGIWCQPLQGGARAFPRLELPSPALCQAQALGLEPDVFFCQQLLEATGVKLAPGSEFGQPPGTHHVGVSLLLPAAKLEQVLLALTHFHSTFWHQFS